MEKETAKIPGSLLVRPWQHSDRSNQLVVESKQPPDARARLKAPMVDDFLTRSI